MVDSMHIFELASVEISTLKLYYCSRVELAGSLRRNSPNPHDIDIVVIPKNPIVILALQKYAKQYESGSKGIGNQIISYVKHDIGIQLFIATENNFGAMMLTRTGSAGYNIGLRLVAKKKGYKLNEYGLWKGDTCIASKNEEDIYVALGKQWKHPSLRN